MENGLAATADWENMKVIDVLPDGVSFAGNVPGEWFADGQLFINADENNHFHAGCCQRYCLNSVLLSM